MSIESWKKEFYPVSVKDFDVINKSDSELVDHCLRKWEGLTKENLEKHKLTKRNIYICDKNGDVPAFKSDATSCALCEKYDDDCSSCPLAIVRGDCDCSSKTEEEDVNDTSAPWHQWADKGSSEYMIYWLNKTKEMTNDRT